MKRMYWGSLLFILCLTACKFGVNQTIRKKTSSGDRDFEAYLDQKAAKFRGKLAPDFEVKLLDGKTQQLKDLRGKLVLLNFWFAACKPCQVEVSSLNQLLKDYKNKGVTILSVGLDNADRVKDFVRKKGVKFTVAPNAGKIVDLYEVTTYPTTFLIDKKGVVRQVFTGASDFDATYTYTEIKPHLEQLLAK